MGSSDYNITLDVHALGSPAKLNVQQGDTWRRIVITLMEGGVPYSIESGCYAVFAGQKPDGKILFNSCIVEGDTIIYELTKQTTVVPGLVASQIRLYNAGGKLLTSPDFYLLVDKQAVNDNDVVTESESEITALTELITEVHNLIEQMEKLKENMGGGSGTPGSSVTLGEVTLLAANWVGTESPYSQVVAIDKVTEKSQVDLKPSVEQLAVFHDKDLAFMTENDGGVVTVYAIGDKPQNDYTIQVSITEVRV